MSQLRGREFDLVYVATALLEVVCAEDGERKSVEGYRASGADVCLFGDFE